MSAVVDLVLLIDDNEADNFFHRLAIDESGLVDRVVSAESGPQALELLRTLEAPPDLIFLDINMPAMNGWEFLEGYGRLVKPGVASKVVLLTTSVAPDDADRARREPLCSAFESKPMTAARFRSIVSRLSGGIG